MRVLNDNSEKAQPSELGFFSILSHSLLNALGIASLILAPLPMLVSHFRLTEPWPKIAALAGALLAMVSFLQVPWPLTLIGFVFGLIVADLVFRETSVPKLMLGALLVAAVSGFASLQIAARLESLSLVSYWNQVVEGWVTLVRAQFQADESLTVERLTQAFTQQGPFLYLVGALLSVWLSVGIAAHMSWIPEKHAYAAAKLRALRFSPWLSILFFLTLLGALMAPPNVRYIFEGLFRLFGAVMFMQGCVQLSNMFHTKKVRPAVRTVLYSVGATLGFYVVVGLGAVGPWFNKISKKMREEA